MIAYFAKNFIKSVKTLFNQASFVFATDKILEIKAF